MKFVTGLTAGGVKDAIGDTLAIKEIMIAVVKDEIAKADKELSHERPDVEYMGGSGYWYIEDGPSEFDIATEPMWARIRSLRADIPRINQLKEAMERHADDTVISLCESDHALIFNAGESTSGGQS